MVLSLYHDISVLRIKKQKHFKINIALNDLRTLITLEGSTILTSTLNLIVTRHYHYFWRSSSSRSSSCQHTACPTVTVITSSLLHSTLYDWKSRINFAAVESHTHTKSYFLFFRWKQNLLHHILQLKRKDAGCDPGLLLGDNLQAS